MRTSDMLNPDFRLTIGLRFLRIEYSCVNSREERAAERRRTWKAHVAHSAAEAAT
jgi:hypothetical protein